MTAFDEAVLTGAMIQVRAQEMLEDRDYCGKLRVGEFEALMRRAGYAPAEAHRAAMDRGWARLCAGEAP